MKEPSDPSDWSIEETILGISALDPSLAVHVEAFRTHEIDGEEDCVFVCVNEYRDIILCFNYVV